MSAPSIFKGDERTLERNRKFTHPPEAPSTYHAISLNNDKIRVNFTDRSTIPFFGMANSNRPSSDSESGSAIVLVSEVPCVSEQPTTYS